MPGFVGGRVGEPSREGLGEAVVDDVVELSSGVVEERLKVCGDDEDVCSERLEMELARLSLVLSFPSLPLAMLLSLSLASCLGASSVEASWPADTMVSPVDVDVRTYGLELQHVRGWSAFGNTRGSGRRIGAWVEDEVDAARQ